MEYAGGLSQAAFSPEEWDGIRKNPEKFPAKYTHIDLVLIPSGQERPIDLKSRIPWEHVEQRQFVCPAYLGEGCGFSWFGRMTLERQFSLREKLGLNGGDDPLQLAADGLAAKDPPTVQQGKTATFCRLKLEHAGQKAAPYLEEVIYEHTGHAARLALTALGTIPGEGSTERLLAYYHSDDKELCAGAESGLCRKPYRVTAKDAYLDMLHRASREGRVHRNALEACIEFGWKKAVPALEEVCRKPSRYWSYRFAVEAQRELQGKEVAAGPGYDRTLEEAKDAILACDDKEIAVLWALELVLDNPKGGAPERNQAGREALAQLPEDVSKPIVVHLAYNLQDYWERERIATLVELYPDNPDTENWSPADLAMKNAMRHDPRFGMSTKWKPQQAAIQMWEKFLKRDDISESQRVFALWRIGSLLTDDFDHSHGGKSDFMRGKEYFRAARDHCPGLISREVISAAGNYSSGPGLANDMESANRLAEGYRWVVTRTDEMLAASAQRINTFGYLPDSRFFVPGDLDLRTPTLEERIQYLKARLEALQRGMQKTITYLIREECNRRAPVLLLLDSLEDIADPQVMAEWRSVESIYEAEWEDEAEARAAVSLWRERVGEHRQK
jgi:hypothetical protein